MKYTAKQRSDAADLLQILASQPEPWPWFIRDPCVRHHGQRCGTGLARRCVCYGANLLASTQTA